MKQIMKSPFHKFCVSLNIIPKEYICSLSQYELVIWLIRFLEEKIIPAVNNNGEVVEELQNLYVELKNYVDNYFDNLDVQEEINNKLNEMVENGSFNNILNSYINNYFVRTFKNVNEMKNEKSLAIGHIAKTLCFSNYSDYGGGYYLITNSETANEMDIIQLNNGLQAKLLYNEIININSLGADNSGTNECSNIINYACKKINDNWLNLNYGLNTINFNGKYKINNQIKFSPFTRFTNSGFTTFYTNINNESAFFLTYLSDTLPENLDGDHQKWCYADIFNFKNGVNIINTDGTLKNTCLEIGTRTNMGTDFTIARYKFYNINIENFNIAILHNIYNNYLGKFERINLENNNIAIQYGTDGTLSENSGEHMSYSECLFAHNEKSINWCTSSFYTFIDKSSFDFNEILINDEYKNGYHLCNITNSHLEGNNNLIGNMGNYSLININENSILFRENVKIESSQATEANGVLINCHNNRISHYSSQLFSPTSNLLLTPNYAYDLKNNLTQGDLYYSFLNENMIANCFDDITDGEYALRPDGNWLNFITCISMSETLNYQSEYKRNNTN